MRERERGGGGGGVWMVVKYVHSFPPMAAVHVSILRVQDDARVTVRDGEIVLNGETDNRSSPAYLWYTVEGSVLRVGTGEEGDCEGDQVVPTACPFALPVHGEIHELEAVDSGELQVEHHGKTLASGTLTCNVADSGVITFLAKDAASSVLECTLADSGVINMKEEMAVTLFECVLSDSAYFSGGPLLVRKLIEVRSKGRSVVKNVKPMTKETRIHIDAEHSARVKISKLPRDAEARAKARGARVSVALGSGASSASSTFVSHIGSITGNGHTVTIGGRPLIGGAVCEDGSTALRIPPGVTFGGTAPVFGHVTLGEGATAVHIDTGSSARKRKASSSGRPSSRRRKPSTVGHAQVAASGGDR